MRPSKPRILIVDDQAANIDVLAEALGAAYELSAATTATRALELAQQSVDLVLLDVVMPDRNGFDLCRALKAGEKTRGIPVIFVTALGEVDDEARGFEAGGVDYITKPISPATVRARVRTHLELRGAQRRLEKEAEVLAENLRLKEHVERLSRHDLKTPLTSVISLPQILLESAGLSRDQTDMLQAIESAGYRILDMVNRSLDLFRMETQTYEFRPARIDLREIAARVADDLASLARERNVTVSLPEASPLPAVAAAEELLTYSMLANLVKNAIEASPKGGVVRIATSLSQGEASISIHNRGAVPASLRDSFFDKYTSSGKRTGTGLGTYSARLMAQTQLGRIAMSTSDEDGTTVTVVLGRADDAPVASPEPEALTREIRRGVLPRARVLIVDDDAPTRFVLARFLAQARAVVLAPDSDTAVAEARRLDPHLVLLDAEMPGEDGFKTAARLRSQESSLGRPRCLMAGLSSHDDVVTRHAFLNAGCDIVLVKPVSRHAVLAAVEAALDASPAQPSPPPPEVLIDADLLPLIPAFLESRREQARDLQAALERGDVDHARALAHKLRGGLDMSGFTDAGTLARAIEESLAQGEAPDTLRGRAGELRAYLDAVQYRSAP